MQRRLSERFLFLLAVSLCCHALGVAAAEALEGDVRFSAARDEPAWVGQEVELNLELWSDGFSFGDQLFILPEVPGGFLLQGDSSTVKLSETRGGVAWQGLRYTLLFYPQAAGRLEVPAFDVSYTARAGFGSAPTAFRFRTEPLGVEVRLPPGARPGDLLVTTGAFDLEANWDHELPVEGPLQLQTGDALTLEIRRRAADVPGMVFAPLPEHRFSGLGVYPAAPVLDDRINRGELTGSRTDSVTFVCESAGRYEIPEWRFQWWDPEREVMAERVIPAMQLEVTVNPAYGAQSQASGTSPKSWRWALVALVAGSLVLAFAWFTLRPLIARLVRWIRERRRQRKAVSRRSGRLLPLNPRSPGP
jgi:hypothetical protein